MPLAGYILLSILFVVIAAFTVSLVLDLGFDIDIEELLYLIRFPKSRVRKLIAKNMPYIANRVRALYDTPTNPLVYEKKLAEEIRQYTQQPHLLLKLGGSSFVEDMMMLDPNLSELTIAKLEQENRELRDKFGTQLDFPESK